MTRPRVLDLFCGAGGASAGYDRAGFDVTGVDIRSQPSYPFAFICCDALDVSLEGFDLVHASPPCQRYSAANRGLGNADKYPDLINPVREMLLSSGKDYVIENVLGAPLVMPVMLCGSMFGLETEIGWLRRHRYFETSWLIFGRLECRHPAGKMSVGVYGNGTNSWHRDKLGRNITVNEQSEAMGIDWMSRRELTQAIPPSYTEWIGRRWITSRGTK